MPTQYAYKCKQHMGYPPEMLFAMAEALQGAMDYKLVEPKLHSK